MRLKKLENPPTILAGAAVVGKKEFDGPLGADFDLHDDTGMFGMDTWEKSEGEMQRKALMLALKKAKLPPQSVEAVFAGDLINQCVGSAYGNVELNKPFFGLYGACSTFAEGLTLSSMLVSAGYYELTAAVSSSHFCSAERQFRFPLEYGGQRPPTSQWTATAAGAMLIAKDGEGPFITEVLPGRIVDAGIKDANNMGAAMAPAAVDTLTAYFTETGKKPTDFDRILTGDLGHEGLRIARTLMKTEGYDLEPVFEDCGLLLYSSDTQDTHAGGSGCGCSASVISAHILKRFQRGEFHDVLYVATGALMNADSTKQGSSIPGIAHLVRISSGKGADI